MQSWASGCIEKTGAFGAFNTASSAWTCGYPAVESMSTDKVCRMNSNLTSVSRAYGPKQAVHASKPNISIYLYLPISICIYLYLAKSISIYLYVSISISISVSISIYLSIYPSIYLSISLAVSLCLSIYLFLYPSLRLYVSTHLPAYQPTPLSI